ncbi:hypothetical protein ASF58_19050 [Methylobacterium sp. Leaf125]|uniref:hypothetical protein n=1 Tax=Methylobacterium sp. Leaf125 TaxID=1736265 RepID=UPI0006F3C935|nr:hypothetical protein [Methylobacterium sp. Leaf125]KQQ45674.1 hypothetical protein ASF58_19050 [Methylobacterium sp. Leaf125]
MEDILSGAAAGAENVRRLKAYLDGLAAQQMSLPVRQGRVNVSAVALSCGFDRQVLYKNSVAKEMLAQAEAELGLDREVAEAEDDKPPVRPTDQRDRRIHKLEQENASLRAEVVGLRERLRRVRHVEEHMADTGRWVSSLPRSLGESEE